MMIKRQRSAKWMIVLLLAMALTGCATPGSGSSGAYWWQPLNTGSDASLRGVCVLNDGIIWASGSGGTVLLSTDAGQTWQQQRVPGSQSIDIRDIEAVNETYAWVIGITEPAQILRTAGDGSSWTVLYLSDDPASFFDSITMLEGGGSIVFGDPTESAGTFEIIRSDDSLNYTRVDAANIPAAREGEAAFAASGTCIVSRGDHAWIGTGGMHARVLRSTDRGRTWTAAETPMPQGEATTGIYSIAFRDQQHGVIVGGDYTKPTDAHPTNNSDHGNAAYTTDGGITWLPAEVPPGGYRSCVIYLPGEDSNTLIAVGRAGCDYSTDGGRTWQPFGEQDNNDPEAHGYYAVAASPDGSLVVAVGANGRAAVLRRE